MFSGLSTRLQEVFKKLRGQARLTESNIQDALREVRQALLEADVNFKVAKNFIKSIQERAVGREVLRSVTPAQQVVKVVHDGLVELMGPANAPLDLEGDPPAVIVMAGLQGSGKTTTCAKLALHLKKKGRKPMLVAADLVRPAAVDQLLTLGRQVDVPVHADRTSKPPKVAKGGVAAAREQGCDTVIVDTAGRLHIDDALMDELEEVVRNVSPRETLLVCDAMTGQDAVRSAEAFHARLPLTGVILTKLDGDARGGAALSVKAVTGRPIKFVGLGERAEALEPFHPDRMASRILGMGDVVTLVEKAQEQIDEEEAERLQEKLRKAEFTFEDYLDQMKKVKKMGSIQDLLAMVPGLGSQLPDMDGAEDELKVAEAMILSMTPQERRNPDSIDGSRRRRIATGSGTSVQQVNDLLKQHRQMRKMMKKLGKGGGRMPPGMNPGAGGLPFGIG